ncbi:MAG: alpha/beta hydrolase [Gammaproteobacteria bacterium]|nr:alpha/beta hydrolase [Gammaproteobacteria bacterium]
MSNNQNEQQTTQLTVVSDDGVKLFVHVWPCKQDQVIGWVHIMHGLGDHGARYHDTAQWLNSLGFHVSADDHRGHGLTGVEQGHVGHMADHNGWHKCLQDQTLIMHTLAQQWPQPLFVLGHSMGGSMATHWLQLKGRNWPQLRAAILSGSHYGAPWLFRIASGIAALERARQGRHGHSALVDKLTLGQFNNRIHPKRTVKDWVCTVPEIVDAYIADPLAGHLLSNQFWFDYLQGLADLSEPDGMLQIPNALPIYMLAGAMDPVGKYGKDVAALHKALRLSGKQDITCQVYPQGRHEMLNEVNKQQVRADLSAWLMQYVVKGVA